MAPSCHVEGPGGLPVTLAHRGSIPLCQGASYTGMWTPSPYGQAHPCPLTQSCLLASLWSEGLRINRMSPLWRKEARTRSARRDTGSGHLNREFWGPGYPEYALEEGHRL